MQSKDLRLLLHLPLLLTRCFDSFALAFVLALASAFVPALASALACPSPLSRPLLLG